jgi:hypothetical protein
LRASAHTCRPRTARSSCVSSTVTADPEGADSHLAYTNDTGTRAAWEDRVMVHYVVTAFFVVVIEVDIYDASRGFNEV